MKSNNQSQELLTTITLNKKADIWEQHMYPRRVLLIYKELINYTHLLVELSMALATTNLISKLRELIKETELDQTSLDVTAAAITKHRVTIPAIEELRHMLLLKIVETF